jgi:hypothetical protein
MINYWVAIEDSVHQDIKQWASLPDKNDYSGSTPTEDILSFIYGVYGLESMYSAFRPYNGRVLYSVYVTQQEVYQGLLAKYPNSIELGAWSWDGSKISLNTPEALNYMHDIFVVDDVDTLAGHTERPTVLKDSFNLLGQGGREF